MKKILLIEDDPVVATVYQRFLQARGFVIEVATDGAKGLEQLSIFEPDAVVLDLIMPAIGGIDVLKALRAQPAFRELPVIVLTNACVPALVEQAMNAGANQVFDKSKQSPSAILESLHSYLHGAPKNRVASTN